ncbi:MAG: NCS2 family permease [Cellulosilyticaceae bacterium]
MISKCEQYIQKQFKLSEHKTSIKTEIIAGITVFATMAYVLATIPSMMSNAGFDKGVVLTAMILLIAATTIGMALYTNRPFVLAPGLGSVGVFSATMVAADGIPIDIAAGVIFWSGVLFVIISFVGLREAIVKVIPLSIKIAISAGIGLFIALLGFKSAGIVVANASKNTLGFGDLMQPTVWLAVIGFVILLIFEARKIRGGMILSIIITTLIGIPLGVTTIPEKWIMMPSSISDIAFNIDIIGALDIAYLPFLFAFFVPDFFSTFGTVIGVSAKAGYLDKDGNLPGIDKCFHVDAIATTAGSLFCMPCMTTYLESAAGVEAGGKTGLTAVSTAVTFLLMLLITPIALMIPAAATAPALMYIGMNMLSGMKNIDYNDMTEYFPAFVCVTLTIFSNNIANGIAAAVIVYVILKLAAGKAREIPKAMYILSVILCYYFYTVAI